MKLVKSMQDLNTDSSSFSLLLKNLIKPELKSKRLKKTELISPDPFINTFKVCVTFSRK